MHKKVLNIKFNDKPFKDHEHQMIWQSKSSNGNWYKNTSTNQKGWLCPMLLHYFDKAQKNIYFSVSEIKGLENKNKNNKGEKIYSIADAALENYEVDIF